MRSAAVGDRRPSANRNAVDDLAEVGIVAFVVLIVALMSNAFQTPMVKALEGYWKPAGPRVRLLERGLARHDERRQRYGVAQTAQYRPTRWQSFFFRGFSSEHAAEMHLAFVHAKAENAAYPLRPSDEERAQAAEDEDIADRLMPTRLGNALRVGEDFAGDRFGLDAVRVVQYLMELPWRRRWSWSRRFEPSSTWP